MKNISRRTTQRRKKRKISKELTTDQQQLENKLLRMQQNCQKKFWLLLKTRSFKKKELQQRNGSITIKYIHTTIQFNIPQFVYQPTASHWL